MAKSTLIAGLDIGTTKICAVIGEVTETGQVDVIGVGTSQSTGIRRGVVVNIEQTVQAIRQAVDAAEMIAGREINAVYAGIAGSHIASDNSNFMIHVKGGTVSEREVERVLDGARALKIPADRRIIHTLPQEYIVDDQRGIMNPVGMSGLRLEAKVHIVTGAVSSAENIVRSCQRSSLEVSDLVLESLASSKAVLTPEEREIGVALVDIGGGTTDIAIFANDSIKFTGGLNLGGQNLSNDIAVGLCTPMASAEKLKTKYGSALVNMVPRGEMIEVSSVGGRAPTSTSRQKLAMICEARMDEILSLVDHLLVRSNYKHLLGAGVVLTGGSSMLEYCSELGEQIFELPTRIGYPRDIGGLKVVVDNPKFATAVGLLRYGAEMELSGKKKFQADSEAGLFDSILQRMKQWFKDIS